MSLTFNYFVGDRAMSITSAWIPEEGLLGEFFSLLAFIHARCAPFSILPVQFFPEETQNCLGITRSAVIPVFSQDFKVEFSNPRQLSNLTHFICSIGADGRFYSNSGI